MGGMDAFFYDLCSMIIKWIFISNDIIHITYVGLSAYVVVVRYLYSNLLNRDIF